MLDHAQDSQEALERADKIVEMIVLEMAVFGGVLFACGQHDRRDQHFACASRAFVDYIPQRLVDLTESVMRYRRHEGLGGSKSRLPHGDGVSADAGAEGHARGGAGDVNPRDELQLDHCAHCRPDLVPAPLNWGTINPNGGDPWRRASISGEAKARAIALNSPYGHRLRANEAWTR